MHDEHNEDAHLNLVPLEGIFSDLAEADMSPPKWVIKNVLPAGITFLAGPPKTMKSTIEMAFACAVAGIPIDVLPADLLEVEPEHQGVVMGLSAEAVAGELRHMVEEGMGVKVPQERRILIADDPWGYRLDDEDALKDLLSLLENRKPKLFFLDPLRDFHQVEERDSGGMNRLLRPIQRWAKENDCAFLVVHHTRKKAADDRTDYDAGDMRGTTALFGIADGVIMVTPKQNGKLYLKGTYKRGPEWERTVTLKVWGKEEPAGVSEAMLALTIHERKILSVLIKGGRLGSLVGLPPKMSRPQLKSACQRLDLMKFVSNDGETLRLTDTGLPVAQRVVRESSKITDSSESLA